MGNTLKSVNAKLSSFTTKRRNLNMIITYIFIATRITYIVFNSDDTLKLKVRYWILVGFSIIVDLSLSD